MSVGVWIVLAILILANTLYVAAEFGAVGVRRSRVRHLSEEGHWLARRLLPYVDEPSALDRYVGASQLGITVSSLMLGAYAQATLAVPLASALQDTLGLDVSAALSTAAIIILTSLTAVQVVVGELVPKAIALQHPTEAALATVLPMQWSLAIFRPAIAVLNGTATVLLRGLGIKAQAHRHLHSPEEIDLLIAESRDGGLLEPSEQQRLRRALHLNRRTARDLMVPLDRLTMVEIGAGWDQVLSLAVASPYSRLPVYRGSPDRVVGHVRVKDMLLRYLQDGPTSVEAMVRPIARVPSAEPADRVLTLLRDRRAHSAAVIDDQNRTLGLVTIQDLLGELFALRPPVASTTSPQLRRRPS
jgi:CBS domain containing-hemolysin-like protein